MLPAWSQDRASKQGGGGIKLAGVESTWHFSISFPRCHIINKLNKLLLTALANLKSYLVDLFPVYPVLQSCWETTMWHCQPLIPRPDIVCTSAKSFPELVCRDAESHWKLLAACIHCWRQQVSQVTFSCPTSQALPKNGDHKSEEIDLDFFFPIRILQFRRTRKLSLA